MVGQQLSSISDSPHFGGSVPRIVGSLRLLVSTPQSWHRLLASPPCACVLPVAQVLREFCPPFGPRVRMRPGGALLVPTRRPLPPPWRRLRGRGRYSG